MIARILASSLMPLALVFSLMATAQAHAGDLTAEQLKALVSGRTWAIDFGSGQTITDPGRAAYWDFRADGSVCGRLHGSKAGTKCADTGKWRLQGDLVCWTFTWLGESRDYRALCAHAEKAEGKTYHLIEQNGKLTVPFYPVN